MLVGFCKAARAEVSPPHRLLSEALRSSCGPDLIVCIRGVGPSGVLCFHALVTVALISVLCEQMCHGREPLQ